LHDAEFAFKHPVGSTRTNELQRPELAALVLCEIHGRIVEIVDFALERPRADAPRASGAPRAAEPHQYPAVEEGL
jgi:hypothetical protein